MTLRRRQDLLRIGVGFASICFAIVIAEALLRVLSLAPETKVIALADDDCVYQRSTNAVLGFELKPNYESSDPDYIQSYESTNSHGLRDVERNVPNSSYEPSSTKN